MSNDYLLLCKLSLPFDDVLDLLARLGEWNPRTPALAIVDDSNREVLARLLDAAASEGTIGDTARERRPETEKGLSDRERQVIRRIAAGRTTRAIANELVIAEPTVKTYIQRALDKLQVTTRAEAIAEAARRGLLD